MINHKDIHHTNQRLADYSVSINYSRCSPGVIEPNGYSLRNPLVAEASAMVLPKRTLMMFFHPSYKCRMRKYSDGRWDITVMQFLPIVTVSMLVLWSVMATAFALFAPFFMPYTPKASAYTTSTLMALAVFIFIMYNAWSIRRKCFRRMPSMLARDICVYMQKNILEDHSDIAT